MTCYCRHIKLCCKAKYMYTLVVTQLVYTAVVFMMLISYHIFVYMFIKLQEYHLSGFEYIRVTSSGN